VAVANILANEEISRHISRVTALQKQLEQENVYLNEEIRSSYNFEEIIGQGPAIREVFEQVSQVAPADTTVLILGETGTGKELIHCPGHS
jgi:transcriptional regulator with GAF, ATPase, and Fis domain